MYFEFYDVCKTRSWDIFLVNCNIKQWRYNKFYDEPFIFYTDSIKVMCITMILIHKCIFKVHIPLLHIHYHKSSSSKNTAFLTTHCNYNNITTPYAYRYTEKPIILKWNSAWNKIYIFVFDLKYILISLCSTF